MRTRRSRGVRVSVTLSTLLILPALECVRTRFEDRQETAEVTPYRADHLHAVLINGGGRRQINYHSHLDHLRRLLQVLAATGVDPARIAVFSADGADPAVDLATREGELPADFWLLPKSAAARLRPPVEYVNSEIAGFALRPATREALGAWFEVEGRALAPGDTLLFYVTDHGKKNAQDLSNNAVVLWGEELSVRELRELLALVDPAVRVVMLMSQCYSGSFANLISPDGTQDARENVCGYFSAPADRKAHGCYAEISGKEALGHSHRLFDALVATPRLGDAQREVLVTDGTPDVPLATTGIFLAQQLERAAERRGHQTQGLVDELLAEAWNDPLTWEREIRLLDRVGQAFGFSSPRSLAQLDAQTRGLSELRDQLDTYADRWQRALDDLRRDNLAALLAAHPEWRDRLEPEAVGAHDAKERRLEVDELLYALLGFTERDREREARLRDLHGKWEEAKAARYRADVRFAVVLRMQALLTEVAGRHYMARYAPDAERGAFARLEACEDLALRDAEQLLTRSSRPPEPFPTLAEERRRLAAVVPGWLGMSYRAPGSADRRRYALPAGAAFVSAVFPDSPAAEAELRVGDIVLGPPGELFQERHAVRGWVMQGEIGLSLPLRLLRDGRELEVTIRLVPYPLELPALPGPPQIGSAAPALELEYLARIPPPEPWRSKLLFFWASWCAPCKQALPELLAFAQDWDAAVVAITDEDPEEVEAFFRKYDGPFPEIVASDRRRVHFQKYGVSGTPSFVLVDADGIVRHYQTGYEVESGLRVEGWQWEARTATK